MSPTIAATPLATAGAKTATTGVRSVSPFARTLAATRAAVVVLFVGTVLSGLAVLAGAAVFAGPVDTLRAGVALVGAVLGVGIPTVTAAAAAWLALSARPAGLRLLAVVVATAVALVFAVGGVPTLALAARLRTGP
jgi:hypothetical protein